MAKIENDGSLTQPRKRKKKKKSHKGVKIFFTGLIVCFMIGVVTCGIVALNIFSDLGIIALGNKSTAEEIAGVDYLDLDAYVANQSQTTIIYAYDENNKEIELARLHGAENRIWCSLDEMCQDMQDAVVALEDKRFLNHEGVDWTRTIAVVVEYNFEQGGSTITQQLIKNLTGDDSHTFKRKYTEIRSALALEKHFSKATILEAYLNTIYADMGCYGIKTAAEYYFGKTPMELTLMESAILASITNAPRYYNPIENYDNNRERAIFCLDSMLDQGYITQQEYNDALAEKVKFVGALAEDADDGVPDEIDENAVAVTTNDDNEVQGYYVDFIIDQLIEDFQSKYGLSEYDAWKKVYFGGLKVYAAVDLNIQDIMEETYADRSICFPDEEDTEDNPAIQSAMVIMDYEGRVAGIVGQIGEKTANRSWNIASMSLRQPGSTIKPLTVYSPAIELNAYYWSSQIQNYGIDLYGDGTYWPTNYGGDPGDPDQYMTLDEAIAPSENTIPAHIVQTLTPKVCFEFLRDRYHITSLIASDENYAPMAIGAMGYGITPLELCAAYVPFSNGGLYYKPWSYYKVTNSTGTEIVLEPNKIGEQVISPGTAGVMNHLLQCVVSYPTGTGYRFPIYGFTSYSKSGTTSDNVDKWIIGGTAYYICCAWTGFTDGNRAINIAYYGSNPAGTVYQHVMNLIHENLEAKELYISEDCVQRSYCTITGLLAGENCPRATGYYKADNLPPVCTAHGYGAYGGYNNDYNNYAEEANQQAGAEDQPAAVEDPVEEPAADNPGGDVGGDEPVAADPGGEEYF